MNWKIRLNTNATKYIERSIDMLCNTPTVIGIPILIMVLFEFEFSLLTKPNKYKQMHESAVNYRKTRRYIWIDLPFSRTLSTSIFLHAIQLRINEMIVNKKPKLFSLKVDWIWWFNFYIFHSFSCIKLLKQIGKLF